MNVITKLLICCKIFPFVDKINLLSGSTTMSCKKRHCSLFLFSEKEWTGHSLRIHGPATHWQRDGGTKRKALNYFLFETEAQ